MVTSDPKFPKLGDLLNMEGSRPPDQWYTNDPDSWVWPPVKPEGLTYKGKYLEYDAMHQQLAAQKEAYANQKATFEQQMMMDQLNQQALEELTGVYDFATGKTVTKRRKNDWYPTPLSLTLALLDTVDITGKMVYEPCFGDGAIGKVMQQAGNIVEAADIDPKWHVAVRDATKEWSNTNVHWVVTNPPFSNATDILLNAFRPQTEVGVAMLLRLSFLEPTKDREWLSEKPPHKIIVLPRTSFTGDGNTDSVTCAWLVWSTQDNVYFDGPPIKVYTKAMLKDLEQKWNPSNPTEQP